MAIRIHTATIETDIPGGDRIAGKRVAVDVGLPNTAGEPSLEEYIVLEAGDDYLPYIITDDRVITVHVGDMNDVVAGS